MIGQNKGKKWFTNGVTNKLCFPGEEHFLFRPGLSTKGRKHTPEALKKIGRPGVIFYTDGVKNVALKPHQEIPPGFKPGRTHKKHKKYKLLREQCIEAGEKNGKGKSKFTAKQVWFNDDIEKTHKNFSSFYAWYNLLSQSGCL